jgi:hypothetical protein
MGGMDIKDIGLEGVNWINLSRTGNAAAKFPCKVVKNI